MKINLLVTLLVIPFSVNAFAASLKVLHNEKMSRTALIDTTVKEILAKDIKIGDESHLYKFEVGKWSCEASFVRLLPESAGQAILNCGNHDGLVISSTGDAATYLEINDGRDINKPIQNYELRLVGCPAK